METKLLSNAADKHDASQIAKTTGVKAERNHRYDNNECLLAASKVTSNGTAPKVSRARRGKAFMAIATTTPPSSSSSNLQEVSLSIPGEKPTGRPLRRPSLRLELVGTRPTQSGDYGNRTCCPCGVYAEGCRLRVHSRAAGEGGARGYRAHRDGVAPCFPERWAAKYPTSRSISCGAAAGTRVAAVAWRFQHHFVFTCFGLAAWRVWRYERGYGGHQTAFVGADAAHRGASCGSRCVRGH